MSSFKIIGFPVLEMKIFLKVFIIQVYERGGHLGHGHVTWTIYTCKLSSPSDEGPI